MKKSIFIILVAYFCLEVYAALSPSQKSWLSVTDTEPTVADTTGYLIVSTPKYREPIKKFMEWKRTLGFLVDTLLLNSNPLTNTQVLDSIQNRYNQNHHLAYLLIVGTIADIPTFSKRPELYTGLFDYNDHYQSGEWEHSTDYDYGLVSQSNDIPLLKRGRIPVATAAEADTVFDKIISYEKTPVMDENFYNRGLHIAQFQDETNDYYEDYRFTLTSEEIRNFMLGKGKQIDRFYTGPTPENTILHWNHTVYASGQEVPDSVASLFGSPSAEIVSNKINEGAMYVLYYDHGNNYRWEHPRFNTLSILGLTNGDKQPLVISCCCHTGDFSSSTHFASTFLKKSGGGAIGVIASTNVILTGFSDSMLEGIFSSIWPENGIAVDSLNQTDLNSVNYTNRTAYRLGDILDSGLSVMKQQFDSIELHGLNNIVATGDTVTNMCIYASEIFHLIGDPTMELRTTVPQPVATPTVNLVNSNHHVTTTDGDARISFYNVTTGAVCSYLGSTAGYACNSGDKVKVSLTRPNYIPYIAEVGGDIYIQNETILGGRFYRGGNIYVGKDVTSTKDSGEVVFRSGSETTFRGGTVKLDKGTTIELGAKVNISH